MSIRRCGTCGSMATVRVLRTAVPVRGPQPAVKGPTDSSSFPMSATPRLHGNHLATALSEYNDAQHLQPLHPFLFGVGSDGEQANLQYFHVRGNVEQRDLLLSR